jgi:hypothetical protein
MYYSGLLHGVLADFGPPLACFALKKIAGCRMSQSMDIDGETRLSRKDTSCPYCANV